MNTRTRLILAVTLGLVGLIAAAIGGFGLSLVNGDNGYVSLGNARFQGSGYAVTTDGYNWSTANLASARYGTVRVQVTGAGPKPIFIGLARGDAVQHYLTDVAYSTATPGANKKIAYTDHQGDAPTAPPAHAGVWLASATGSGTQTFQFDPHANPGNLVLVAMNADGTPVVGGTITTAATAPGLTGIVAGVLAAGVVATAGGVVLFLRRRAA